MWYAIGRPGSPVRLYVQSVDPSHATSQLKTDEVVVEVAERQVGATIAADGKSVVPNA